MNRDRSRYYLRQFAFICGFGFLCALCVSVVNFYAVA
jgi:hypothetical protein